MIRKWHFAVAAVLAGLLAGAFFHRPLLDAFGTYLVEPSATTLKRPSADLIVVLDGHRARHEEGVRLLHAGAAPRILFTMRRPSEKRYERYGVSRDRAEVPVAASDNTYEEAVATRETVRRHGYRSILLVTSDYHTRRALRIFKKVLGPSIDVSVVAVPSGHLRPGRPWWRYGASRRVIVGEYMKLLYYWVRYPGGPAVALESKGAGDWKRKLDDWTRKAYRSILDLLGSGSDRPPSDSGG